MVASLYWFRRNGFSPVHLLVNHHSRLALANPGTHVKEEKNIVGTQRIHNLIAP